MTIIEKIKQSVEGATGMPFLYHAADELNELIARCKELPVAYSFLLDSGTIDDVNGRYHERVTLAVMFCDKTEFDFNALENEEIIDRMKVKAYKWIQSLRMSNALRVVSVNNTQRLYDNTTDVLTGFAVNITLEDIAGLGECELPDVVFEIKENGEYPVVGIDKVIANVLPKSTDIVITENGDYYPQDYEVDAFSKVDVDVKPKLEDLTATDNGTYTPSEGFDGFGKVNVDLRGKVKVNSFKVTNGCINEEGRWEGETLIDTSECTSFLGIFQGNTKIKQLDLSNWNVDNVTTCAQIFLQCVNLEYIKGLENWHTDRVTDYQFIFQNCYKLKELNLTNWYTGGLYSSNYIIGFIANCYELTTLIGGATIEEVLANNISCMNGLKVSLVLVSNQNQRTKLDRASLRALINGLAEVETTQTLTLGATLRAKLTEEDIAIATAKNWSIT